MKVRLTNLRNLVIAILAFCFAILLLGARVISASFGYTMSDGLLFTFLSIGSLASLITFFVLIRCVCEFGDEFNRDFLCPRGKHRWNWKTCKHCGKTRNLPPNSIGSLNYRIKHIPFLKERIYNNQGIIVEEKYHYEKYTIKEPRYKIEGYSYCNGSCTDANSNKHCYDDCGYRETSREFIGEVEVEKERKVIDQEKVLGRCGRIADEAEKELIEIFKLSDGKCKKLAGIVLSEYRRENQNTTK